MKVKNIKEWHIAVYDKYHGICQGCKHEFNRNMACGHHVKSKGARPDLKLEVDNGVLTCNTPSEYNKFNGCHNQIHNGKLKVIGEDGEFEIVKNY